jgi:hypothetical protein
LYLLLAIFIALFFAIDDNNPIKRKLSLSKIGRFGIALYKNLIAENNGSRIE